MPVIAFVFSFVLIFVLYVAGTATKPQNDAQDSDRVRERLESVTPRSIAS